MKLVSVSVAAVLLGAVFGAGIALWELMGRPDDFGGLLRSESVSALPAAGRPRAVVEGDETYAFGAMDYDARAAYSFAVRNLGDAPLTLTAGPTTCGCTLSQLSRSVVPPGESAEVRIEWHADEPGAYRQTAVVLTNDPERPQIELVIHGFVTQRFALVPQEVALGGFAPDQERTAELDLLSYYDSTLNAAEVEITESPFAAHFAATVRPMTAEEVARHPYARSGLRATVSVKPGLPLGPIVQTIRLTPRADDAPTLEATIRGRVVGDITLFGSRDVFDPQRNLVVLGVVDGAAGRAATLQVLVRGPHRDQIELSVARVEAESLRVVLGPRESIGEGRVIRYLLTVEVPPGASPANHLGTEQGELARVVLATNHPEAPEILLFVRFAVN